MSVLCIQLGVYDSSVFISPVQQVPSSDDFAIRSAPEERGRRGGGSSSIKWVSGGDNTRMTSITPAKRGLDEQTGTGDLISENFLRWRSQYVYECVSVYVSCISARRSTVLSCSYCE